MKTIKAADATTGACPASDAPRVWVLVGDRVGDDTQSRIIAEALDWPLEEKSIRFTGLNSVHYRFFGPSLRHVDRDRSSPLRPPWPDLVIAAGRKHIPIALWIREQSHGRTRLVQIGRPQTSLDRFDLVIANAMFRLPDRPNVLHLQLPLMRGRAEAVKAAADEWAPRLAGLPRPWVALLVGGPAKPFAFGAAVARRMIDDVARFAENRHGSLLVSTSPRTPAAAADALQQGLPAAAYFHRWRPGIEENPYIAFLGLADFFVVTGDSISMLVEVARQGKPLAIYPLPPAETPRDRLRGRVRNFLHPPDSNMSGVPKWRRLIVDALLPLGLFSYPRDLAAVHQVLVSQRLAVYFGDPFESAGVVPDELDRVVARIKSLLGEGE